MDTYSEKLQQFFASLRIVYADNSETASSKLIQNLVSIGLNNIITVSESEELNRHLDDKENAPDLIILDFKFFGDETIEKMQAIRGGKIGQNPFINIVGIIESTIKSDIISFMHSGIDELLLKPIDAKNFLTRLNNFTRGRKPFIATMNYIGPDRRKRIEQSENRSPLKKDDTPPPLENVVSPKHIFVPNSIQLKTNKSYAIEDYTEVVQSTLQKVHVEVLRGCAFQMIFNSVILAEASVRELKSEIINNHATAIDANIKLANSVAEKAKMNNDKFVMMMKAIRQTYETGYATKDTEFDLGVTGNLMTATTELGMIVYQQTSPYRIISEIRESAQKFMLRFYPKNTII